MVARAATVTPFAGQVLINQGDGYIAISGPTTVNPGDSVMAYPGASAEISYGDGCTTSVQPGSVAAVSEYNPCTQTAVDQAPGETGADAGWQTAADGDFATILVGAGLWGGGIAIAIAATGGDDDKRRATSP